MDCDIEDQCKQDPCENGGSCSMNNDTFTCSCSEGYHGDTCANDVNECEPKNPCQVCTLKIENMKVLLWLKGILTIVANTKVKRDGFKDIK